jgi:membrane dipeptidase
LIVASLNLLSCHKHLSPLQSKAYALAHSNIIVDGHVDLPYRLEVKKFRLEKEYLGMPIKSKEGDFDYVRAKEGGLSAPFMSIYIPAKYDAVGAKKLADSLINMIVYIAKEKSTYFAIANSPSEVAAIKASGRIALPMGMENGSPISTIDDVDYFKQRGISYVTLTHSKVNKICDSSYDTVRTYQGLSSFGYEVVQRMNEVGIMVDISHVSDSTFYDVMAVSKVPTIASHSSCRKFTPGFERNMSDDMIRLMGKNGGVIMVNFATSFINGELSDYNKKYDAQLDTLLKLNKTSATSDLGKKLIKKYRKDHPIKYADIKMVADHIDHIKNLAGLDHVGLGSDYDGVGDSLPHGLKDVSDYPNLIEELLMRGYSEQDIAKICYQNIFRVWQQTIDYSANHGRK